MTSAPDTQCHALGCDDAVSLQEYDGLDQTFLSVLIPLCIFTCPVSIPPEILELINSAEVRAFLGVHRHSCSQSTSTRRPSTSWCRDRWTTVAATWALARSSEVFRLLHHKSQAMLLVLVLLTAPRAAFGQPKPWHALNLRRHTARRSGTVGTWKAAPKQLAP